MSEKIVTLSDATFDEHVKSSDLPVLVDFWAEWCGPCKMISPVLEEIAEEQAGKIQIGKLNIDDNLEVTRQIRGDEHPDVDPLQGRAAGSTPDRGEAEGSAPPRDRGVPVGLPLSLGDEGDAVSDVQRRLTAILNSGAPIDADGFFGDATRAAIEAFQHLRGLRVDGVCGSQTWNILVEAGFRLGDRFLYRRTPMLRGDDVVDLQQRLSTLGFDTGRVDGIFGDRTSRALAEFQRNVGMPVDGIAGGATLRELIRLESRHEEPELISSVRARAQLRHAPPTLTGRHVAIGERGGLGSVTGALRRRLVLGGTQVTDLHHPDDSMQAHQANDLGVDVFLGLRLNPALAECHTSYWAGIHDQSQGGRLLAELIQEIVPGLLGIVDGGAHGMSLAILRETRMPSVLVELGPASLVVERAALLAAALSTALGKWADASWD